MISAICCTYRRFSCVERLISYFLNQTYQDWELIIYNTDTEYPLQLGTSLLSDAYRIGIVNNNTDFITGLPYTNVGAIRRDALTYADGEYYTCADDDDLYLPWHLSQGIEGIKRTGKKAFKPKESFFRKHSGEIEIVKNVMEASILVDIREVSFDLESGKEHLTWYTRLRDLGELNEDEPNTVPAYCFDWLANDLAAHKQSGDIDNPNNFENHKRRSIDYSIKPLEKIDVIDHYKPFVDHLNQKGYNLY